MEPREGFEPRPSGSAGLGRAMECRPFRHQPLGLSSWSDGKPEVLRNCAAGGKMRAVPATGPGAGSQIRNSAPGPLMRGSDWVPGAGRCQAHVVNQRLSRIFRAPAVMHETPTVFQVLSELCSEGARSPLSHSTRRMLRLWVSGSIPSIAFCSASCGTARLAQLCTHTFVLLDFSDMCVCFPCNR